MYIQYFCAAKQKLCARSTLYTVLRTRRNLGSTLYSNTPYGGGAKTQVKHWGQKSDIPFPALLMSISRIT